MFIDVSPPGIRIEGLGKLTPFHNLIVLRVATGRETKIRAMSFFAIKLAILRRALVEFANEVSLYIWNNLAFVLRNGMMSTVVAMQAKS